MPAESGPSWVARGLYGALMLLLLPLLLARQWWRGRRLPEYRAHWRERLGLYAEDRSPDTGSRRAHDADGSDLSVPRCIWVHAVSLGETQASLPLLRALSARWPDASLLLTHMTPTGRAAGAAFSLPGLRQAYLPYDAPGAMGRFLDHFRPDLGLLMETEVWPGLVQAARARGCPVLLVNARLSARSLRGYRRLGTFARAVFAGLSAVGAQTAEDAQRLALLGAGEVEVTGNLKFELAAGPGEAGLAQRFRAWWGERPVWLAASTREGEEALVLDAHCTLLAQAEARAAQAPAAGPAPLLVLVPRHPQRFDEVAQRVQARGLSLVRRSAESPVAADCTVVLGDSLGELGAYYRSADLAFVGGSLVPLGGQNLLEACARACPVLIGPHTFNFALAAEQAVAVGAARRVADAAALAASVAQLLATPAERRRMASAGTDFIARHQGASARTLALVERAWQARRAQGRARPVRS